MTKRIKIGTAVVTLPLANPLRVVENTAFVDISSNGRFALGLGSGYRNTNSMASASISTAGAISRRRRCRWCWSCCSASASITTAGISSFKVDGAYELFPHALQEPHPPIFEAARPSARSGRRRAWGSAFFYRAETVRRTGAAERVLSRAARETPPSLCANPACGQVDVARWVYVAETDAKAKSDSEAGIMRNLAHFGSGHASGYLGTVGATMRDYDTLTRDIILHGSPATVIGKIEELQAKAHNASLMLHFPPWYGADKALASLELFAAEVMPKFRREQRRRRARERTCGRFALAKRPVEGLDCFVAFAPRDDRTIAWRLSLENDRARRPLFGR